MLPMGSARTRRAAGVLFTLALALALALPRPAAGQAPPPDDREATLRPWSGWWWPLAQGPGPHLDDPDGPLAKYDRYCVATGRPDPRTRLWEQLHSRTAREGWWGHCHGWAAAAVLEPEPAASVERAGVRFSVADLKGLLTAWHAADGPRFITGGAPSGVSALDFHNWLRGWLITGGRPLIADIFADGSQVWNYPAYRAHLEYQTDAQPGRLRVAATLWFAATAAPESTGTQSFTRTYTYWIQGDPAQPAAAEWEGAGGTRADRPWVLWYPDPALRLQGQAPPGLDSLVLREILGHGFGT